MRAIPFVIPLVLLAAAAGCGGQRQPVIPRAAFTERGDHRQAVEGADTTRVRVTWPDFVGARTPEALDSLRAAVNALRIAPVPGSGQTAASPADFMDGFIARWNVERQAARRRVFWRLERRIEVLAETLGVVSLAATDVLDPGRGLPLRSVRLVTLDADHGRSLAFADLFREESRDSLEATLEPLFRAARGIAPDSSLAAAGFPFADGRFHVGDPVAITRQGVRFLVDASTGFTVPFDAVRPFARADGPLGR